MNVDIEVRHDGVTVEGTAIARPSRISPSQWYQFWEARADADAARATAAFDEGYEVGFRDGKEERKTQR